MALYKICVPHVSLLTDMSPRQNMLVLRCSRKEVSETFDEVWEANGSVLSGMFYSSLVVSTFIRVVHHQMNRYVECKY
jgi:hypothetical protein